MSVDNAILLAVTTTLLSFNIGNTLSECVSDSPCSCVMPNGEGYDLSKITGPKEFIQSNTVSNRTFFFHPCHDEVFINNNTHMNMTGCSAPTSGISLCLYDATSDQSVNLGTVKDSKLTLKSKDLPQIIVNNTVTIKLICDPEADALPLLSEHPVSNTQKYNLMLVSPHACKKDMHVGGLSTGSVLVIILFVFSGIYFTGGALALKLLRGATGWEMLPNHKFWFDLPALVRDGVAFTFNGCKVVSYDQI